MSACYHYRTQLIKTKEFLKKVSSLWSENRNETILLLLILLYLDFFSYVFIHFCHAFYTHFCRAFSYFTKMRFHHQLMRFHKTAARAGINRLVDADAKCVRVVAKDGRICRTSAFRPYLTNRFCV